MDNDTLREIRSYKKMTQKEFAEWLGVGINTIAQIESGNRDISDNLHSKLAHKFHKTDDFVEYLRRKASLTS